MTKINTWQQRGKPIAERFFEKVEKTDKCWEWTSAKNVAGYGIFWVGGDKRIVMAHRLSWELANGVEFPKGLVAMHSCNNKGCVNPSHLSPGTAKENSLMAARDGLSPRGERNGGGGKLTESDVAEILRSKDEIGCCRAAKKFGVSMQTIKAIRRRKIWRHVQVTHAIS